MFSTSTRVALSEFVILMLSAAARALSACAWACAASALAFLSVARSVTSATTRATMPPPNIQFKISLVCMPARIQSVLVLLSPLGLVV